MRPTLLGICSFLILAVISLSAAADEYPEVGATTAVQGDHIFVSGRATGTTFRTTDTDLSCGAIGNCARICGDIPEGKTYVRTVWGPPPPDGRYVALGDGNPAEVHGRRICVRVKNYWATNTNRTFSFNAYFK